MITINPLFNYPVINKQNVHPLITQIDNRTSALRGTTEILFYFICIAYRLVGTFRTYKYKCTKLYLNPQKACFLFTTSLWIFEARNKTDLTEIERVFRKDYR